MSTPARRAGSLLSVNVGMPQDVAWRGQVVHTAVWKRPADGPRMVRRLNIDGDGQGDLAGHGGEHRAVFVYQIESYRYWQQQLSRTDFVYGQFGENFTVDGLADDQVCIGDRYRVGEAVFEVTQPRVTCYRVGIRMDDPRADVSAAVVGLGVDATRIRTEIFGVTPSITPGIAPTTARAPHQPLGEPGDGPNVAFARSGLTVRWDKDFGSLLELAEACDVPVRWSCRTGVCHTCETALLSGAVSYDPDPVDDPADGSALICCSKPHSDLALDL
jgi:ferredoxin